MNPKFFVIFFVFILLVHSQVSATSLKQLLQENELSIRVYLKTKDELITKKPIDVAVEVATKRWFAKGTSLNYIQLPDAVVLPNKPLAINSSKRIDGVTWATQIREIRLYPMRAGQYQFPAVTVSVSVNSEKYGIVTGTLLTKPFTFEVVTPNALAEIHDYIVSPEMTLTVDGQFSNDDSYRIGDAVTQTITFTAVDVPGMMLPDVVIENQQGLSIYRQPVSINDDIKRDRFLGYKRQSQTYIFEKAGAYQLPEQTFYWWQPEQKKLMTLTLPAQAWTVKANTTKITNDQQSILPVFARLLDKGYQDYGVWLIITPLLLLLGYYYRVYRHFYRGMAYTVRVIQNGYYRYQQQQKLRQDFIDNIKNQHYQQACHHLYQIHHHALKGKVSLTSLFEDDPIAQQILFTLFAQAYQDKITTDHANEAISLRQAKLLLVIKNLKKVKR